MENFQIYLAGGMGSFGKENFDKGNNWRLYCKKILEGEIQSKYYKLKVINPNDYFNFLDDTKIGFEYEKEAMEFDLDKVRKSDLIIINFNDMYSLGSMAELAIAYERRIPVLGLDIDKQKLHPWEKLMCNKIFDDIDHLLDYTIDFYIT